MNKKPMTRTKPSYLISTAIVVALAAVILTWRFYGDMAAITPRFPIFLFVLTAILIGLGVWTKKKIENNEIGQDRSQLHPLTVVRILVWGTSCAWFGAICAGAYAGMGMYVFAKYSILLAARADAPNVIAGFVGAIAVSVAGLWLEKCCSAPPPSDEDSDPSNVVWSA